jgi:hypothetical protein
MFSTALSPVLSTENGAAAPQNRLRSGWFDSVFAHRV